MIPDGSIATATEWATVILLPFSIACATLSAVATLAWAHRNRARIRPFIPWLLLSSAAALPGVLFVGELAMRFGIFLLLGCRWDPYDLPTVFLGALWLLFGPILIALSLFLRRRAPALRGMNVVQASHALTWASSSFVTLQFAMLV